MNILKLQILINFYGLFSFRIGLSLLTIQCLQRMVDNGALTIISLCIPCISNLFSLQVLKLQTSAEPDLFFFSLFVFFFTLLKDCIRTALLYFIY